MKEIIRRAQAAQKSWARLSIGERTAFCDRLIDLLREQRRSRDVVELIFGETGTPRDEIDSVEIGTVLFVADYYRKLARQLLVPRRVKTHPFFHLLKKTTVLRKPRGVVGIIAPVNFPFCFALDDAIPALIAGNAVIVKPSEKNPQSALAAKKLLAECGVPDGLYQVMTGGGDVGQALVASDGVDMICFTGSTATGRKVAEAAAKRLIPCHLELSGKAPAIVFADAPLQRAARGIVWGSLFHTGQDCVSIERVFVHENIHDAFVDCVLQEIKSLRFGRDLGPLLSARQVDVCAQQVADAEAKGASILCGGAAAGSDYYLPTLLTNVTAEMKVAHEETFGPLIPIIKFQETTDAIHQANHSAYGLQATVWTRDRKLAARVANELHVGNVLINEGLINFTMVETPFGGVKQSGIGTRHGAEGLLRFTSPLTIVANRFNVTNELYWFPYTPFKGRVLKQLRSFFFHPWVRRWMS